MSNPLRPLRREKAARARYFAWYNYVRLPETLQVTLAMRLVYAYMLWELEEQVRLA
jgi:hypothetical protein